MVFQLGETGVSKFKNMWKALEQDPPAYSVAASEMLDSRWAKQTPNRANGLANLMKGIG
jgi:lysozyme